jgi:hypothetical protein
MTRLPILEKQNKDLNTRIKNMAVKQEMERNAWEEERKEQQALLKSKDEVIKMLQKEIAGLTKVEREIKEGNKRLQEKWEKAEDRAKQYHAQLQKDSQTSSKPPATDGYRKPKVYSSREKSGKKRGGQPGHAGHTLRRFANPTVVIERRPPTNCPCGGEIQCGETYRAKQQVDVVVVPVIEEERVYTGYCTQCGSQHSGTFSEEYVNPVQYGAGLKAMIASLNAHANVTVNKTAAFLNSITDGLLSISEGTVVNIIHELSSALDDDCGYQGRVDSGKNSSY